MVRSSCLSSALVGEEFNGNGRKESTFVFVFVGAAGVGGLQEFPLLAGEQSNDDLMTQSREASTISDTSCSQSEAIVSFILCRCDLKLCACVKI